MVIRRGRVCCHCDQWKPDEDFAPSALRRRNGATCRECVKEANRKNRMLVRYGLTQEAFEALTAAQGGVCALCGSPPPPRWGVLHVDHDHRTGRIRGLLCANCNTALGTFGDSVEGLERAIAYLRRPLPETGHRQVPHHQRSPRLRKLVRHGGQYLPIPQRESS